MSPEIIKIREMLSNDIKQVIDIERLCFTTPWSKDSFISEIYSEHSITKVAEIKKK